MPQITLRAARVNAELTLTEAAKALNISDKTLGSWERGETEPKVTQYYDLCKLYGVPVDGVIMPKISS